MIEDDSMPEDAPMDYRQQISLFCGDLESLVVRYQREFDIPSATLIGVLELMKQKIILVAFKD